MNKKQKILVYTSLTLIGLGCFITVIVNWQFPQKQHSAKKVNEHPITKQTFDQGALATAQAADKLKHPKEKNELIAVKKTFASQQIRKIITPEYPAHAGNQEHRERAELGILTRDKTLFIGRPDSDNSFPEFQVSPSEPLNMAVSFRDATPGESVLVYPLDGGHVRQEGKHMHLVLTTDAHGHVEFPFEVGQDRGIYRIVVRRGDEEHRVLLWAGEPLSLVKR